MTETANRIQRVMHELKPRPVEVATVEDVTPRYRRITFTGPALADFVSLAPSDHIKFQIEVDGEPVRRDYTPRSIDDEVLTVEFSLHASGPITTWARSAQPGDAATILGPRGSKVVAPEFDGYVMVGDETMLPAIGRALEMLPSGSKVLAVIEVEGADDEFALVTETDARIVWAHRQGRTPGVALLEALTAAEWPSGEVYCWAGGEAGAMRDVRRHVVGERGVKRELLGMSGHWKRGESNFDHHSPIEE